MSTTVDQRVVEMRFDNKQFENNIQTSLSSIDKLKKSLNMDGATKGLESVEKASGKINLSGLSNAVETVNAKFSALEVMAITALANITNSAVNAGKSIVSALTIDPIKTGFEEYETQINAVQTILANTSSKGTTLDQVNNALDELNHYADMTIYNFTEMTRNIGTFTAAGVDLDTSVSAIKGIANLAAVSGSNSQQASTAMYQLSQALAAGTVKLQDWNSVVNAGMGGQVFQDALKETARVHGIAIDEMIEDEGSFRETLSKGWLTSDILTETLSKFTGDLNEEQLRTMGYTDEQIASIIKMGQTANDAATKVKTFTQLFDTLKEAAQSGWTQSWEIIVGDFEEAKELLTEMSDAFSAIINSSADARNSMLQGWKDLGGRTALIEAARNTFEGVLSIIKPVKEAFREIFPPMTAQQLYNITDALRNLTAHLKLSDTNSENLKRTFKGLFAVIDIVKQAFVAVAKGVGSLLGGTGDLASSILSVTARFGDWLVKLDETIKKTDIFNVAIQTVIKYIKTGVAVATDLIDKVVDAVTRFANAIKQKYDTGGFAVIHSVLERVHTRMSEVGEAADGMRSGVEIAIGAMGKALENSKFLQAFQALWDGVKTIGTGIATKVSELTNDSKYTTMSDVEKKGYQTKANVTKITKDTVTTTYVNALDITAKQVNCKSGSKEANINAGASHYKYSDEYIGEIGTNGWTGDDNRRGLVFDLDENGDYMTWAAQPKSGQNYLVKLLYERNGYNSKGVTYDADTINLGCDIDMHYYKLKNVSWENGGGITGTMRFVQVGGMNSDGTVSNWSNNAYLQFERGVLIKAGWYDY